ncbi:MAG: sodium:solute symporter family protein [Peptococcaceae bacterium]
MEVVKNPNLLWYLGAYVILMIGLGVYGSKKVKNSDDFILAGKSLGMFVLMGTLVATWCGSGTVTGGPTSLAYNYGIGPSLFYGVPSILGIISLFLIAEKIRSMNKHTIPEILEEKYGPVSRGLGTIIVLLSYVGIISYQFTGLGYILNATTGISVDVGTIVGAFVMVLLATMGGLKSVAPTDAISATIMVVSLIIAVPAAIVAAGGWEHIVTNVPPTHLNVTGSLTVVQLLGYLIPTLFLILGDQNMYQRITAGKENKETKSAIIGWFVGMVIIMSTIPVIGIASRSMFPNISPGMALIATSTVIPQFIGGCLLTAVAAFIVTTGDSFLLSASTNFTYDFYGRYINRNLTDKAKLMTTKLVIPIIGLFSYIMVKFFPTILAVQMYSYTVYGAGITPAVLGAILWKRVNRYSGIASMLTGVIVTLLWEIPLNKPYGINSSVISVPLAVIVLCVVTLMTAQTATDNLQKTI